MGAKLPLPYASPLCTAFFYQCRESLAQSKNFHAFVFLTSCLHLRRCNIMWSGTLICFAYEAVADHPIAPG